MLISVLRICRVFSLFLAIQKVFSEAEEMAQRYQEQIAETQPGSMAAEDSSDDAVPFDDEALSYANWKWLKFSKSGDVPNLEPGSES